MDLDFVLQGPLEVDGEFIDISSTHVHIELYNPENEYLSILDSFFGLAEDTFTIDGYFAEEYGFEYVILTWNL